MSIYYNDYGKRKKERKTNAGANKQFAQIVKDVFSYPYNIPMPPTNADGSFKSVDQMVGETRLKNWREQQIADEASTAAVYAHEQAIKNDPKQMAWEREQRKTSRAPKESRGIPVFLKIIIALVIFMLAGLSGSDIALFIVGVGIFAWIAL